MWKKIENRPKLLVVNYTKRDKKAKVLRNIKE